MATKFKSLSDLNAQITDNTITLSNSNNGSTKLQYTDNTVNNYTITVPAKNCTLAGTDEVSLKAPLASPALTGTPTAPTPAAGDNSTKIATTEYVDRKMTRSTAVNASGTAVDFTGIPSWVKRITVLMSGISLSGTSLEMVQLGSGAIQNSGYSGAAWNGTGGAYVNSNGFKCVSTNSATDAKHFTITIINISGNTWVVSISGAYTTPYIAIGGGSVTLSGALDRLRVTAFNGTDTFDAGTINIIYEG